MANVPNSAIVTLTAKGTTHNARGSARHNNLSWALVQLFIAQNGGSATIGQLSKMLTTYRNHYCYPAYIAGSKQGLLKIVSKPTPAQKAAAANAPTLKVAPTPAQLNPV